MTEEDLYDYLGSMLPSGLQFVAPYLDDVPVPNTDWAQMTVIDIRERGWSQQRQISYDDDTGIVTKGYDVLRVYKIQFDFYGKSAYDNVRAYKQNLEVNIGEDTQNITGFKLESDIRNLTFLQENKMYLKRYSFDLDLFIVDTIIKSSPTIDKVENKIFNRGNNYP